MGVLYLILRPAASKASSPKAASCVITAIDSVAGWKTRVPSADSEPSDEAHEDKPREPTAMTAVRDSRVTARLQTLRSIISSWYTAHDDSAVRHSSNHTHG